MNLSTLVEYSAQESPEVGIVAALSRRKNSIYLIATSPLHPSLNSSQQTYLPSK